MRIGIIGSRGIPNHYGGFEQFAEHLSLGLVQQGWEVWVYNSHTHPFQQPSWKGVNLIHCFDPEDQTGTAGQFIYDLNCIIDSRKRNFDVLLQLGYTSSSVWHWLLPKTSVIVTNMDGLEWKRSKYSKPVRHFLKYAEKLAVRSSDCLVADSLAIQDYLQITYQKPSVFIPYGAEIENTIGDEALKSFGLEPGAYYLLIARMQPDNHIEEIIRGVSGAETEYPLLVVGNTHNRFGRYLKKKYESGKIVFKGAIFEKQILNELRHHCRLYFHGHSSGGTNPSLLEAMAASALICAHDNPFNRSVLGADALYFSTANDISGIINNNVHEKIREGSIAGNLAKIRNCYNWENVISQYRQLLAKGSQQHLITKTIVSH